MLTVTEPCVLCTANIKKKEKGTPAQWDCLHTVRNVSQNHGINIVLHFYQYFVFGKNILKLKGSAPTNMLAHRFCISCKVSACAWVCISSSWFFKHLHIWAAGLSQKHGHELWAALLIQSSRPTHRAIFQEREKKLAWGFHFIVIAQKGQSLLLWMDHFP